MTSPTLHPTLAKWLSLAVEKNSSDLHLVPGKPPMLRIDSRLMAVPGETVLTAEQSETLLLPILSGARRAELMTRRDIDFSFGYGKSRFRVNYYYGKGTLAGAFRLIPSRIRTIAELNLPPIVERFVGISQGFVIVTGPTGHGKSTTLAAIIDEILRIRDANVITLEDPVEYVFEHQRGMISQREVGSDVESFPRGLRAALREDPDVVLIGEMRDTETMETALNVAETGHLVLTTLHANSAAQTADRIIAAFPEHQQSEIRQQLAAALVGVLAQRLIPKIGGGRFLAVEIMLASSAVRACIRENKTFQLDNVIATSGAEGMVSLDKVLAQAVTDGQITLDTALMFAGDQKAVRGLIY